MKSLKLSGTSHLNTNSENCENCENFLENKDLSRIKKPKVSVLLNTLEAIEKFKLTLETNNIKLLNLSDNYINKITDINRIYIPLKYFSDTNCKDNLKNFSSKVKLYIYMPTIIRESKFLTIKQMLTIALQNFDISGVVISNISQLEMIKNISQFRDKTYDLVGNYTLNLYNSYTAKELTELGLNVVTFSPELKKGDLAMVSSSPLEIIVSGKIPVMHTAYCLLGHSNKCYNDCKHLCTSGNTYYLKDRYGFNFMVVPDNLQTITTIFNSRDISFDYSDVNVDFIRVDIG